MSDDVMRSDSRYVKSTCMYFPVKYLSGYLAWQSGDLIKFKNHYLP